MTLRPGGQMVAELRGQARSAHAVQIPLPTQPICSARLEFIMQRSWSKCSKGTLSFLFSSYRHCRLLL